MKYCSIATHDNCRPVMAFGRVRTGIRPRTDRHLSVPRSGQFLNMVRPGRVGPTSVKYPKNPGQIQESLKTDRVFITSSMDVTGRVLKLKCNDRVGNRPSVTRQTAEQTAE